MVQTSGFFNTLSQALLKLNNENKEMKIINEKKNAIISE